MTGSESWNRFNVKRARRIFIFGGFGGGNFGNDACLEATLLWARGAFEGAVLSAVCDDPDLVTQRYGIPAIHLRAFPESMPRWLDTLLLRQPSLWLNWWLCMRALGRCDLLLVAGTGVIHDYRDRPWGWPSRFLRWMLAARLSGVPVLMACVGAGPVINPVSRAMMRWCARLAARRCYRDEDSRNYMSSIGVDERTSAIAADLAFLLPARRSPARPGAGVTIGVGLMNYRGWRTNEAVYRAYIENAALLVGWLKSKGYGLRVLIGQTPTDLVAVNDVEARLGYTLMNAEDRRMNSFQDVMNVVAETDVVLASRYHVQIAALKLRRPVVSLSYGPMNNALMDAAGLSEFVHDIEQIEYRRLVDQTSRLIDMRAHFAEIVDAKVSALEAALPGQLRTFITG